MKRIICSFFLDNSSDSVLQILVESMGNGKVSLFFIFQERNCSFSYTLIQSFINNRQVLTEMPVYIQLVRNFLIACMIILNTIYLGNLIGKLSPADVDIYFMFEYARLCSLIMADELH